jgi:GntR family transcriptional regulator / MocR family aminotransferase
MILDATSRKAGERGARPLPEGDEAEGRGRLKPSSSATSGTTPTAAITTSGRRGTLRSASPASQPGRAPDVTLFPRTLFARALADAVRTASAAALDYGDPAGLDELCGALATHLGLARGVVTSPDRIIVTQGTAQAIDLVLRVLRDRGVETVALEDPSLESQHRRVRSHGLTVVGQPADAGGMVVDGLRGDAAIVMPAHQFPTGTVLRGERRRQLAEWAREHDRFLPEDDYDAELRHDRMAVRALQGLEPDRVIYLGTTSKTLAPGLRMGWIAAPAQLVDELRATKILLDTGSPALPQLAVARLLRSGEYARHVRRVRAIYRRRLPGECASRRSRSTASRMSRRAVSCWGTAGCTRPRSRLPFASSRSRCAGVNPRGTDRA